MPWKDPVRVAGAEAPVALLSVKVMTAFPAKLEDGVKVIAKWPADPVAAAEAVPAEVGLIETTVALVIGPFRAPTVTSTVTGVIAAVVAVKFCAVGGLTTVTVTVAGAEVPKTVVTE